MLDASPNHSETPYPQTSQGLACTPLSQNERRKLGNSIAVYLHVSCRQAVLINWWMCIDACFCVCVFRCMVSCLIFPVCSLWLIYTVDIFVVLMAKMSWYSLFSGSLLLHALQTRIGMRLSELPSTQGKSRCISYLGLYLGHSLCCELAYHPVCWSWCWVGWEACLS